MNKVIIFFILIGMSHQVAAVTTTGEISIIYPNKGVIHFKLKDDSCNTYNKYYYFSINDSHGDAWYSLMLAAANVSKPISVSVEKCSVNGDMKVRYIFQNF